jgi:hypothetical protein
LKIQDYLQYIKNNYFIFILMKVLHAAIILCIIGESAVIASPPVTKLSSIAAGMQWVGKAVDEPDYYVWCTSPIQGEDKKTHLFCSRWPKKFGMAGWSTHSEVAHYVGDSPEGPFRFVNIALECHPDAPWNNSMHNPAITKVGDKYVLLYISFERRTDRPYLVDKKHKMFTGMAVSDSLNGPWIKQGDEGKVFIPSPDPDHWTYHTWAMDNPTFLAHGGKFYIYFKGSKEQLKSRYGYAVADSLEGPYRLSDSPCTDNIDYIEDATAFVWNKKICLLTNDNMGKHTGVPGQGILWFSDNPTDFKLANAEIGFLSTKDYYKADMGKARILYGKDFKFERPGILLLEGKPAYFYGPSGVNLDGDDHTCSYVMKIDPEHSHQSQ